MTNEQQINWDSEMQERVFGASPRDDYNFKTPVYPKYSTEPSEARRLVDTINASGRYRMQVRKAGDQSAEWAVEVRSADGEDCLSQGRGPNEAPAIVEAIMTADVKL